jgi:hypothetical protein
MFVRCSAKSFTILSNPFESLFVGGSMEWMEHPAKRNTRAIAHLGNGQLQIRNSRKVRKLLSWPPPTQDFHGIPKILIILSHAHLNEEATRMRSLAQGLMILDSGEAQTFMPFWMGKTLFGFKKSKPGLFLVEFLIPLHGKWVCYACDIKYN